jgi:hypothetical protein
MSEPYRLPQVEEQIVLDELQVQVVGPEDHPRFQSLLRRHHYLQGIKPVGERLYLLCGDVARPRLQTDQGHLGRFPRRIGPGTPPARVRPGQLQRILRFGGFMSQP